MIPVGEAMAAGGAAALPRQGGPLQGRIAACMPGPRLAHADEAARGTPPDAPYRRALPFTAPYPRPAR